MAEARRLYFESHLFQLIIDTCMDERLLDVALAFGELDGQKENEGAHVPPGIMEVMRTGGGKTSLRSLATCDIEDKRVHKHRHWGKLELRLCLAHWSSSHEHTASCAAWKHDTRSAVGYVREFAAKMNYCYPGAMVAIYGLMDTDHDSVVIFGPGGELDTMDIAHMLEDQSSETDLIRTISARLRSIFSKTWGPIAAIPDKFKASAFYRELAEYLAHNVDYVRRNLEGHRKIQLLEHAGRVICIGRHFEFLTEPQAAFLLDDHDANLETGLVIGFRNVGRNNIIDADGSDDWVIPVHINIPHSGDSLAIMGEYALETRERIRSIFSKTRRQTAITSFWLDDETGVPKPLRHKLRNQIEDGLDRKLAVSVSVSDRNDRLFRFDW
jgi:hypothetical protein